MYDIGSKGSSRFFYIRFSNNNLKAIFNLRKTVLVQYIVNIIVDLTPTLWQLTDSSDVESLSQSFEKRNEVSCNLFIVGKDLAPE